MVRKGLLFLLSVVLILGAKDLKVYFLDVGEGEASLIITPDGKSILIDAGNVVTGFRVVEFLRKQKITSLDAVIITHPHPDHMSGIFAVASLVKIKKKYDNGQPFENPQCPDIMRWYAEFFRKGDYSVLKRGDILKFGKVQLRVLSPEKPDSDWNSNSLVILLTYGSTKFLFMGDAPIKVERELLRRGDPVSADVLKVGHHGASDALSSEFLNRVNPTFAVISINKNNIRGYPAKSVLRKLKNRGIGTYLTYEHGTVLFTSDGEGLRVWAGKGR